MYADVECRLGFTPGDVEALILKPTADSLRALRRSPSSMSLYRSRFLCSSSRYLSLGSRGLSRALSRHSRAHVQRRMHPHGRPRLLLGARSDAVEGRALTLGQVEICAVDSTQFDRWNDLRITDTNVVSRTGMRIVHDAAESTQGYPNNQRAHRGVQLHLFSLSSNDARRAPFITALRRHRNKPPATGTG